MSQRTITISPGETVIVKVLESGEKENYSISEFARLSGLSRSTIYRKHEKGEITFQGTDKSPKISHEQLIKFKK
jgi:hypothetical protein